MCHRSDGSGTTDIFTKAMAAFSPQWAATQGFGDSINWTVDRLGRGRGGSGNRGVALCVTQYGGAVGYIGTDCE